MTRMAIQLHGAIGTTNEYDIGLYLKRALMLGSAAQVLLRTRHARLLADGTTFTDPDGFSWEPVRETSAH